MTAQLTLQPETSAAGIARRWVKQQLTELSRPELLEASVLGVSELVTNALLHVRSTIQVRIVDEAKLRIEVYDHSDRPPEGPPAHMIANGTNPATIGRGLQIVDSISMAWGVAYDGDGKCVWFQPRPEGSIKPSAPSGGAEPAREESTAARGADTFHVALVDAPVNLLARYRVRFSDLRRELTLIALDASEHTHVGNRLDDVAKRLERYGNVGATANTAIDDAIAAGRDRTTVHYDLPRAAVPGLEELRRLLARADEFCRDEQLLTLAAGPQERALRSWCLDQMIAQAGGAEPIPWPGSFVVTDPDPLD